MPLERKKPLGVMREGLCVLVVKKGVSMGNLRFADLAATDFPAS